MNTSDFNVCGGPKVALRQSQCTWSGLTHITLRLSHIATTHTHTHTHKLRFIHTQHSENTCTHVHMHSHTYAHTYAYKPKIHITY